MKAIECCPVCLEEKMFTVPGMEVIGEVIDESEIGLAEGLALRRLTSAKILTTIFMHFRYRGKDAEAVRFLLAIFRKTKPVSNADELEILELSLRERLSE